MNDTNITPVDAGLQRMIRAHLWYGAAGLVLGLLAALASIVWGADYFRASPLATTIALAMVGFISVSMLGGLLTFCSEPKVSDA
jgi:hypothetical protein